MFQELKNDEHLMRLIWRLGVVLAAIVLALMLGVAFQWIRLNTNIGTIDSSIFRPSGVSVDQFSYEEKLLILDSLSTDGSEASVRDTPSVQVIAEKEAALEVLTTQDSGGNGMSAQEKLDILNQLK